MKHPILDNEEEIAKVVERRGRLHAFPSITPVKTAFVVIDLMRASIEDNARCQALLPEVDRLAGVVRDAGGTVAWVTASSDGVTPVQEAVFGQETARFFHERAQPAHTLSKLPEALHVAPADLEVTKSGFSAFFPGSSTLHQELGARGIDTVVVCGVATNICCESSARDAVELGYKVIMVGDLCVGPRDGRHQATLTTFFRTFGDVRSAACIHELFAHAT